MIVSEGLLASEEKTPLEDAAIVLECGGLSRDRWGRGSQRCPWWWIVDKV